MKMCEKCHWDHDCSKCDEMMAYFDYYCAQIQIETGIGYYDLLDAVEGWYDMKAKEWNKYKADALETVRKRIKEEKI